MIKEMLQDVLDRDEEREIAMASNLPLVGRRVAQRQRPDRIPAP